MLSPLFTIIIPTFNSGKTLQHALDSILQQEFTDLEVVVVDGLSKDDTVAILQKNSEKDQRVRFVSEKDKGIFDAMNKGIMMARGTWLYFMGSDDRFYNNKVLQQVDAALKSFPCDVLYGTVYSAKNNGIYGGYFDKEKILFSNISHQAAFYRKTIHERLGFYNNAYPSFADWDFNIRCFLDDQTRKQYVNIVVAYFAMGGASTVNPDTGFLRNALFPQNLYFLNNQGARKLYRTRFYDQWWRLVRSLQLAKDQAEITQYASGMPVPAVIKSMASFQKRIPYKLLKVGVVSKTLMAISYCGNIILNKFGK